jgi:beta-N-acetylhexosaminidase
MVGIQPGQAPGGLDSTMRDQHVGGVIYLGGWNGSSVVTQTSAYLQGQATGSASGGVRLVVAADQEGGQVQQLKGSGFTTMPSALSQGQSSQSSIEHNGATVGAELKRAGVNINLAPVADTVPADIGSANAPIGRYSRQFGDDPATVTRGVAATIRGLAQGGVASTVKHFPGLGRVSGNTDTTDTGITDDTATTSDPFLAPFSDGVRAGAQLVMISSARYPKMDPANAAVFSPAVISGLLRDTLGYGGVVISDDLGAAKSVAAIPAGERAVRFVAAGGDIILTATSSTAPAMATALTAQAAKDSAFAQKLDASVRRVIALKVTMGLASCG